MKTYPVANIESIIKEYIEFKERSILYGRKKLDAEKEYNKLLTKYNGEAKNYSLQQANKIYTSYLEMLAYAEESKNAEARFLEAETKLREIGQILFEASISADIPVSDTKGDDFSATRAVTVTYNNGHVIVN